MRNPLFYATVATVLPLLLLAVTIGGQQFPTPTERPARGMMALGFVLFLIPVVAEAACFVYLLFEPTSTAFSFVLAILSGLGVLVALFTVATRIIGWLVDNFWYIQ